MNILLEDHLRNVTLPANIIINDQIKKFREYCRKNGCIRPYHHFAFGQSPFPPPPPIVESLSAHASQHDYLPTAGILMLREVIADYYKFHFGIDCDADQVVISPGSKEMIAIILAVLQGSVIIPTPSWVSYLPQAEILKKQVIPLRTKREDGFKLTPGLLLYGVNQCNSKQKILILNHPNNPTGVSYTKDELQELADVCKKNNVVVIADEIYALTSFDPLKFKSMGKLFPEMTIVTGGLSKDRSAGGYRLGVGLFPKEQKELLKDVLKIAGSTYSCVAAPIQYAALTAYSRNEEVETYMQDCCRVNSIVGKKMAMLIEKVPGIHTTTPEGGFYLYVDFNEQKEQLKNYGFETCADFAKDMLMVEHTALLPGSALLLPDDDFSVRCSYVDYDGGTVLAHWRKDTPKTTEEEDVFVRKHCPLVVEGVKNIARYIEQVRQGKKPVHV